ncbi:MAG: hypothetical protein HXX09_10705 [Bacteroidetes bacterium]|nr:hypothetical protein [Bacteroidota bacterium]
MKTIFINSLIPSIVISKPSLVLEEIHKTDKDYFKINGNDVRLSLKDKILDQIPELKKKRISLLDIRNISVHEFSCSFFDLTKYYNNLLTYLDDINSFVKNQKPKNK